METTTPLIADGSSGASANVVGPFLARALHDSRWSESTVRLLAGGRSNLTYVVSSAAGELILRRPPLGHLLPKAHDVLRKRLIIHALGSTSIPVPPAFLAVGAAESPSGRRST